MKTCNACGAEKDLSAFYKDKSKADGRCNQCIPCQKKRISQRVVNNAVPVMETSYTFTKFLGKTGKVCRECLKPADAPKEQQSADYPICAECLSRGWITDAAEISTEIATDQELCRVLVTPSPKQESGKKGGRPKKIKEGE